MNAIVFCRVATCLYAANTWHLFWPPLAWLCFLGVLVLPSCPTSSGEKSISLQIPPMSADAQ
jgi:hypothetical protein